MCRPGRITGLAGESGSGKTTVALTAIGYLPAGATLLGGAAVLAGRSILSLSRTDLRRSGQRHQLRGSGRGRGAQPRSRRRLASRRNPDDQPGPIKGRRSPARAIELLEAVSLPSPEQALRRYPHQFSGGQLQRVAIAMAIASDPKLIVFDEPTTGLDVTTHAEVIAMLNRLIRERDLAAIYISHDLALLAAISDELVILYAGEVVESGPTKELLRAPRHPYTRALLDSLPSARRNLRPRGIAGLPPGHVVPDACGFAARCPHAEPECTSEHPALRTIGPERIVRCVRAEQLGVLPSEAARLVERPRERVGDPALQIDDLVCVYGRGADRVLAVDGVSMEIREREVVGLVGESGSGKSTIGRAIVGLLRPQSGAIRWRGQPLPQGAHRSQLQHREIQIIFQNPDLSLNPRQTVGQLVGRAAALFRTDVPRASWPDLVASALREVQLDPDLMSRYPHQISGGQKQRVAMARALIARPRLVICDEIILWPGRLGAGGDPRTDAHDAARARDGPPVHLP